MTPRMQRVAANAGGRDFLIGDLHGCLDQLQAKLVQASFAPEQGDRLFAVGDLVDRGPDSLGCLNLLREPWFFSVLGNHDQMLLDALADPQRYKPESVMEEFLRNVPVVRRGVAGGRPEINILGVPIEQDRKPWSRAYTEAEHGVAHVILSKLMARGEQLPVPSTSKRVFVKDAWTTIGALGGEAEWKYQKYVGDGYASFLTDQREMLMKLQGDALKRFISNSADRIKSMAAMRVADQSK